MSVIAARSWEEINTEARIKRAVDQIGHALKDHGLFVTIDTDGNFGVDKLPAEFPIKDERVMDNLRRRISENYRTNRPITGIRMLDQDARRLAAEVVELGCFPTKSERTMSEQEIYEGIAAGEFKFMDVPVTVTG